MGEEGAKISPEAKEPCAPFCRALTEVVRRGDEGRPVRTAADEPLLPIRRLQHRRIRHAARLRWPSEGGSAGNEAVRHLIGRPFCAEGRTQWIYTPHLRRGNGRTLKRKRGEKTKRGAARATLRVPSPCDRPRGYRKERVFPVWKRKNKIGQPWERCKARAGNDKCCNGDACRQSLVPVDRCDVGIWPLFCPRLGARRSCHLRCEGLAVRLVPRLRASSRDTPRRLPERQSLPWCKSAHCRGSEGTSPPIEAAGRGA